MACFLFLCPFIVYGQILNIDKSDTADYINKTKTDFNFSTGLEVDRQQITLWDATNTAEFMLQKNKELIILAGSYRFTYNGADDILNAGFIHLRYRHNYKINSSRKASCNTSGIIKGVWLTAL